MGVLSVAFNSLYTDKFNLGSHIFMSLQYDGFKKQKQNKTKLL